MKKNLYFFIRHFISLLAATFLLQLVAGCSGYWEDSLPPRVEATYIRFVSPSGTNVFDSLCISTDSAFCVGAKAGQIGVELIRQSDGARLYASSEWFKDTTYVRAALGRDETVLRLTWCDFNGITPDDYFNDVYEIRLTSPLAFRSDETHVVKWRFRIEGGKETVEGCTVDDEPVRYEDDPFYRRNKSDEPMGALLTVRCK